MIEILEELDRARRADGLQGSIKVIWEKGFDYLKKDDRSELEDLTIDICRKLTESVVVSKTYLNVIEKLYYESVESVVMSRKSDLEIKSMLLYNSIVNYNLMMKMMIEGRIRISTDKQMEIYLAEAKEDEFFITKDGILKKKLLLFDHWYENDKKTIENFYRRSIKEVFEDSKGYLVFIDKPFGTKGPIKLKDYLKDEFKDLGIITIKNNQINIEKDIKSKKYCILDDVIDDDYKNIIKYKNQINNIDSELKLSTAIILYDNSEDYILKTRYLIDPIEEPVLIGDSTNFEAIMFGLGSAIGFWDVDLGLKFKKFARYNTPWGSGNKKTYPK